MKPDVSISFATPSFLIDVRTLDFSFTVSQEIKPEFDRPLSQGICDVEPYEKRYFNQPQDFSGYIDNQDAQLFAAHVDRQAAGYLAISRHWNGLALVEDIAIGKGFRQQGCGRLLMDKAQEWAREKSLSGLTLETQSNNVAACLFYERYGFRLSGIDRDLYRALDPLTHEIALFWYLWFE